MNIALYHCRTRPVFSGRLQSTRCSLKLYHVSVSVLATRFTAFSRDQLIPSDPSHRSNGFVFIRMLLLLHTNRPLYLTHFFPLPHAATLHRTSPNYKLLIATVMCLTIRSVNYFHGFFLDTIPFLLLSHIVSTTLSTFERDPCHLQLYLPSLGITNFFSHPGPSFQKPAARHIFIATTILSLTICTLNARTRSTLVLSYHFFLPTMFFVVLSNSSASLADYNWTCPTYSPLLSISTHAHFSYKQAL